MDEIDLFVEFLIRENCDGCHECEPRLTMYQAVKGGLICCEQGRTQWFLKMAEEFKKQRRQNNAEK